MKLYLSLYRKNDCCPYDSVLELKALDNEDANNKAYYYWLGYEKGNNLPVGEFTLFEKQGDELKLVVF